MEKCDSCQKSFTSRSGMLRHVREIHQKNNQHTCSQCSQTFSKKYNLVRHHKTCKEKQTSRSSSSASTTTAQQTSTTSSSPPPSPTTTTTTTTTPNHICIICRKVYSSQQNLQTHQQIHSKVDKVVCDLCGKPFSNIYNLNSHKKSLSCMSLKIAKSKSSSKPSITSSFACNVCKKKFVSVDLLRNHPYGESSKKRKQSTISLNTKKAKTEYTCTKCDMKFFTSFKRDLHFRKFHTEISWEEYKNLYIPSHLQNNVKALDVMQHNIHLITQSNAVLPSHSIYNYYNFENMSYDFVDNTLDELFSLSSGTFKINIAFGFIMIDITSEELSYFYPGRNFTLLDIPFHITCINDLRKLKVKIREMDLIDSVTRARESTKFKLLHITNCSFFIYNSGHTLGCSDITVPDYITNSKVIITGNHHNDNLCFFRSLALHNHRKVNPKSGINFRIEHDVDKLFSIYLVHREMQRTEFKGVTLSDIPELEDLFRINVNIFSKDANTSVTSIYTSMKSHPDVLYLNLYSNHLSYITNFKTYAQKFKCKHCHVINQHIGNHKKHEKICNGQTKYIYPGKYYEPKQSIYEKLEDLGIWVDENERFYKFHCVYDFESLLKHENSMSGASTEIINIHKPISVSINSNVIGFDKPKCFINRDTHSLVSDMVNYMRLIQNYTQEYMTSRFDKILCLLEEYKSICNVKVTNHFKSSDDDDDDDDEYISRDVLVTENIKCSIDHHFLRNIRLLSDVEKIRLLRQIKHVRRELNKYINQLVCLGFNSSRYDLNLVRNELVDVLGLSEKQSEPSVIKKLNSYSAISTKHFSFLDISHYLAGGCSYDMFLKAMHTKVTKGFFPYEYLDSDDKLNDKELPSYEAFYSRLKRGNVLSITHDKYKQLLEEHSEEESLNILQLTSPPNTGAENYSDLKKLWHDSGFTSLKDLLEYYNNRDVGPFVEAVGKLVRIYKHKNIDLFKGFISAPGVARRLIFKSVKDMHNAYFSLFDKDSKDVHALFRENITGGPAIVFTRYHEAGITHIREIPKKYVNL